MLDGIADRDEASATWDTQPPSVREHNDGMNIEVLHIDECPNWEDAGKLLSDVIDELGIPDTPITFTLIRTPEEAAAHLFAGSPTILIDGADAVPGADPSTDVACRIYRDGPRSAGIPSRENLRQAVLSHLGAGGS